MVNTPAAFMSYSRFDDELDYGFISKFRHRLSGEVKGQTGCAFPIFQDRFDITWGRNWSARISEALDGATFLIPILTPNFFMSSACRHEVACFMEREQLLGRDDLILPIYYIDVDRLVDSNGHVGVPTATLLSEQLSKYQYVDWRKLRGMPIDRVGVQRKIRELAGNIADRLRESGISETEAVSTVQDPEGNMPAKRSARSTSVPRKRGAPLVAEKTPDLHVVSSEETPAVAWSRLVAALKRVTFTPADPSFLALQTKEVRLLLAQPYPAYPIQPRRVEYVMDSLLRALNSVLPSRADSTDVESACEVAERLRVLLIGLITEMW